MPEHQQFNALHDLEIDFNEFCICALLCSPFASFGRESLKCRNVSTSRSLHDWKTISHVAQLPRETQLNGTINSIKLQTTNFHAYDCRKCSVISSGGLSKNESYKWDNHLRAVPLRFVRKSDEVSLIWSPESSIISQTSSQRFVSCVTLLQLSLR